MPWCPECRYEYQPEIQECPDCHALLVDVLPPLQLNPKTLERMQARERRKQERQEHWQQVTREMSRHHQGFRSGLRIARSSVAIVFRARRLLLVAILLAVIPVLSNLYVLHFYYAKDPRAFPTKTPKQYSPLRQWVSYVTDRTTLRYMLPFILKDSHSPLPSAQALEHTIETLVPSSWRAEILRHEKKYPYNLFEDSLLGELDDQGKFLWLVIFPFGKGVVHLGIATFIFTGFLCWLSALAQKTKHTSLWSCFKTYYLRISLLYLCVYTVLYGTACLLATPTLENHPKALQYVYSYIFSPWIYHAVYFLLILTPFCIVNYNFGIRDGIKAGILFLWHRRWAFLAILLFYRIVYEVIYVGSISFPIKYYYPYTFNLWENLLSHLPADLSFALLGLWLAMAFTILILPKPETVEVASENPSVILPAYEL